MILKINTMCMMIDSDSAKIDLQINLKNQSLKLETSLDQREELRMMQHSYSWTLEIQQKRSFSPLNQSEEESKNFSSKFQPQLLYRQLLKTSQTSGQSSLFKQDQKVNVSSDNWSKRTDGMDNLRSSVNKTTSILKQWQPLTMESHMMARSLDRQLLVIYLAWFYLTWECIINISMTCITDGQIIWILLLIRIFILSLLEDRLGLVK